MTVELRQSANGEYLHLCWPYDSVTVVNGRRERFSALSLEVLPPLLILRQHDEGKVLARAEQEWIDNTPEAFTVTVPVAAMPDTTHVADVLAEVRAGVVAGVSPAFLCREQHNDQGTRTITRAQCVELSIVTVPAYPTSAVELRADSLTPAQQARWELNDRTLRERRRRLLCA